MVLEEGESELDGREAKPVFFSFVLAFSLNPDNKKLKIQI